MSDYIWMAAGVIAWLAAGLAVSEVFGKTVDEMEEKE